MPGIVLSTEDIKMMMMMMMTLMMLMIMMVVMTLMTNATYPLQISILRLYSYWLMDFSQQP